MKNKLKILVLAKDAIQHLWKKHQNQFERYFNLDVTFDQPNKIEDYLYEDVDILFVDDPDFFKIKYYPIFRNKNPLFSYIVISKNVSEIDIETYKRGLADRIIYTEAPEGHWVWAVISAMRRYWNSYSKPSTIIYKGIIADFLENKFSVDKNEIALTPKEIKLLWFLIKNKGRYVSKSKVYKMVWGHEDLDVTRSVDQTFFKLKKKIGENYFASERNMGIKFE